MGYKTQDDTISYEYNTIDNQNGHDFDETQFEIQDIYYIWYKWVRSSRENRQGACESQHVLRLYGKKLFCEMYHLYCLMTHV